MLNNISTDIHSLSDFKRRTSDFVEQMRGTGHPLVLTINGKAAVVVQDAAAYQELYNRIDELESLAGIKRGLKDVAAGRVTPLKQFEKGFRSKHGLSGRSR
jgi:prevent-host-death family protein